MSLNIAKTKSRIHTVSGAHKITSAMKLVSSIKLSKNKNKLASFSAYNDEIETTLVDILNKTDNIHSPYITDNEESKKDLFIVITSSLGLCGAYNSNIFSLIQELIKEEDDVIVFGEKGNTYFKNGKYSILNDLEFKDFHDNIKFFIQLSSFIKEKFLSKTYRRIHCIYTKYKNSLTFVPTDKIILPISFIKEDISQTNDYIIEPDKDLIIKTLFDLYIDNNIRNCFLESDISEQASRNLAMDNSTKNAEELLETLKIEFNKARQNAITQEIIEIVSASNNV